MHSIVVIFLFPFFPYFIPSPRQTGRRRHYVLNLSVRSSFRPFVCLSLHLFVCYQTCDDNISKTSDPILMQIGTSGQRGQGMKLSTLEVRRSKIKVT